jgi:hypothetical protein
MDVDDSTERSREASLQDIIIQWARKKGGHLRHSSRRGVNDSRKIGVKMSPISWMTR